MKILAIGAHADDVEIGMGGTVARYIDEGNEVKIVCAILPQENINGNKETEKKNTRKQAAIKAANILGASIDILNIDPYEFEANRYYTKLFDDIVRNYNPDRVYVNWHHDSHQDHKTISQIIFSTARKNNFSLYMYESMIPGGIVPEGFRPQMFVNISDNIDKKLNSLKTYSSINLFGIYGDAISGRAKYRGGQIGVKYAEAFEIVKEIRT